MPVLLDDPTFSGEIIVRDNGATRLVILSGDEFERLAYLRRERPMRAHIVAEMDRRRAAPGWGAGLEILDEIGERAPDLSEKEFGDLISEAIDSVRSRE